jgi:exosortase/archaeosortase family protein
MIKSYFLLAENFIRKHKLQAFVDVVIFALITYVFHRLWWNFYSWLESFDFIIGSADWLARQVYLSSLWFNKNILFLTITTSEPNTMWFSNGSHVKIDEGCSGLKQFYQILVLFVLFPGPWKHKMWYIPFGFFVMFLANIFRIVCLSLIALWIPQHWDFAHEWILRPFFYVIIFLLWVYWVEKFRRNKKRNPERPSASVT